MFIDLNYFLRWAMWPMGLLLSFFSVFLPASFFIDFFSLFNLIHNLEIIYREGSNIQFIVKPLDYLSILGILSQNFLHDLFLNDTDLHLFNEVTICIILLKHMFLFKIYQFWSFNIHILKEILVMFWNIFTYYFFYSIATMDMCVQHLRKSTSTYNIWRSCFMSLWI